MQLDEGQFYRNLIKIGFQKPNVHGKIDYKRLWAAGYDTLPYSNHNHRSNRMIFFKRIIFKQ